jgi:hypothetical protein
MSNFWPVFNEIGGIFGFYVELQTLKVRPRSDLSGYNAKVLGRYT